MIDTRKCLPPVPNRPSKGVQALKATHTAPSRTPLGESLGPRAASQLAANPLEWHLQYWLDISTIGILRGEDPTLMDLRLEIEIDKTADTKLKEQIYRRWDDYQLEKGEKFQKHFTEEPVPTEEIKTYVRDLDRMLEDKEWKARGYLRRVETVMMTSLQAARAGEARAWFETLLDVYQKLDKERRKDAEVRLHREQMIEQLLEPLDLESLDGSEQMLSEDGSDEDIDRVLLEQMLEAFDRDDEQILSEDGADEYDEQEADSVS